MAFTESATDLRVLHYYYVKKKKKKEKQEKRLAGYVVRTRNTLLLPYISSIYKRFPNFDFFF